MAFPANKYHLRPAHAEDANAIVALVNSVYRGEDAKKSWTTEAHLLEGLRIDQTSFLKLLSMKSHSFLVLQNPNEKSITGCVHLELKNNLEVHLGMLSVNASAQSAGLGSFILSEAERYSRKNLGVSRITMSVISSRTELLKWYQKRGYSITQTDVPFTGESTKLSKSKAGPLSFCILEKSLPK